MIFTDLLENISQKVKPEFDQLMNLALKNQTHSGDLLLVLVNGFYNPDVHNWTNLETKLSPYMIGPNDDGLSEQLHYKFIHEYRTNVISEISLQDYLKEVEYAPEKREKINNLTEFEGSSIQLEMLIYLKIWEADAFIKKFYQLARLISKESYDWHFKIQESNRDDGATGKRHEIIRTKIRDRFKEVLPNIYNSFKTAYLTQIRNSIAHSKYSFLGRNIHPNNYISTDKSSQLKNLPFDDWIKMFHETMVLYNEYIGLKNKINEYYATSAEKNQNVVEVRINRKDPSEYTEYSILIFRPEFKDWRWEEQMK